MLNSVKTLIRFYASETTNQIEKIKEELIHNTHEFHVIRSLPIITDDDEARAYTIANRLLSKSMDIINLKETLEALTLLDETVYPEDHTEEHLD